MSETDENAEFPPFEDFEIESIDHHDKSNSKVSDLNNDEFIFDEMIQNINNFIDKQISNENLIYIPKDFIEMLAFSPVSKDIYSNIKDQLINFSNKFADEMTDNSVVKISEKWHQFNKIISNINFYFNIFVNEEDSFSKIICSVLNKKLREKNQIIEILHSTLIDSFNKGIIKWFSVGCSDILTKCDILNTDLIINQLDINFGSLKQIDNFIQILHSLIPFDKHFIFLDFLIQKVPDFSPFFIEVPQNWKFIVSLYEIYEYKKETDDFISKFTSIVKSQFTAFNPFQIFDEIHSLSSTNLMFVIRNIAITLFNGQNEMFSVLLANYIHATFISLQNPISDERLYLFDEFCQLSNGLFIRYHSHNLLRRLLNFNKLTFDADERFAKICDHRHVTAIIEDFKDKQRIINEFSNPSQMLTFSLFNSEFFSSQVVSKPVFPRQFSPIFDNFESFCNSKLSNSKICWDFSLAQVTLKAINLPDVKYVKCNGIIASVLLNFSEKAVANQNSLSKEDLMKELQMSEKEITDSIESLTTFSLLKANNDGSFSLNTSIKDSIDDSIVIPFIPGFVGVPNQTMVNTAQLEALITKFVKLHPNHTKEDVFNQLSGLSNFSLTEQEYYNSLRSLIKKQIISPLDSNRVLNLSFS